MAVTFNKYIHTPAPVGCEFRVMRRDVPVLTGTVSDITLNEDMFTLSLVYVNDEKLLASATFNWLSELNDVARLLLHKHETNKFYDEIPEGGHLVVEQSPF